MYGREKETNNAVQCICVLSEVQLRRNITPSSGSMSMATSLILVHENAHPGPIDLFDALVDVRSSHALGAPS